MCRLGSRPATCWSPWSRLRWRRSRFIVRASRPWSVQTRLPALPSSCMKTSKTRSLEVVCSTPTLFTSATQFATWLRFPSYCSPNVEQFAVCLAAVGEAPTVYSFLHVSDCISRPLMRMRCSRIQHYISHVASAKSPAFYVMRYISRIVLLCNILHPTSRNCPIYYSC